MTPRDIFARYIKSWGRFDIVGQKKDGKFFVSTVLPTDTWIWETMVFKWSDDEKRYDTGDPVEVFRYKDKGQATIGHDKMIEKYIN